MENNKLGTYISINYCDDWNFIRSKLDKEYIENVISAYADDDFCIYGSRKILKELGLEAEEELIEQRAKYCRDSLMYGASKKMWREYTEEQVNAMLKGMHEMNAISVMLPDGENYSAKKVKESWINANNEERQ